MVAIWIAIGVAVLDQWTKQGIRDAFALGDLHPVLPGFFNLTYLRNTGAAWGMLRGQNIGLTVLSLTMLLTLAFFWKSFLNNSRSHRIALGCMIGGILGNLLDRIRIGYVTDFLDFHIGARHWPSFNVADAAICTGVGLYFLSTYLAEQRQKKASGSNIPAA
jgi:signal peptidase II